MSDRAAQGGPRAEQRAELVMSTVRQLVDETHPQTGPGPFGLDSRLDRDIGLDSVAIAELAARLEDAFGVSFPEHAFGSAATPRDLLDLLPARSVAATSQPQPPRPLAPEAAASPDGARSLVEVLDWHTERHGDRPHVRVLGDDGLAEEITYAALRQEAAAVAEGLRARGVGHRSTVAIMLPTGRDYFTTFLGVLLAGGIPVPIYPPARPAQLSEHLRRLSRVLDNAEAVALVTVREARRLARMIAPHLPSLHTIVTADELRRGSAIARPAAPAATDIALLQYTSGSTGDPKGVVLTHADLLANIRGMGAAGQVSSTDVFVSWLPLYHDMGLIGAWLTSLRFGFPLVVMSPLRFLARPARWLQAIHSHGGTISGGPNFGFELCLRRISDADMAGVDLESWRIAFNGAEPVSPDTVTRFADRFAPFGLRREAIVPVYGLAECAVALTVPPLGRGPRIDRVAREGLARQGRADPAADDDERPARYVACGRPLPDHEVRIVDEQGQVLAERQQGRIQFRGPSATSGYHRNPQATRELFDGAWLQTGDLGYLAEGDLFVTGRTKDLIIRAGRNVHPAELEEAVGSLPGVRKGCVAALASIDQDRGTERLVVVAETRETSGGRRDRIRRTITATCVDLLGLPPDAIVLAPPGAVPKTSSGKIRRSATRDRYESGRLGDQARAVWWQVTRLGLRSVVARARRGARGATSVLYGLYARALFVLIAVLTWPFVLAMPGVDRRWRILRRSGALLLAACGVRVTVEGAGRLPDRGPYVVAANHASNVDSLMIVLAVRRPIVFAAVEGVAHNPFVRLFLRRMGVHLVGEGQRRRGTSGIAAFEDAARAGRVVAFFPEGHRATGPGLEPFRMGAFVVAARTAVPVVPVTIRGTRHLLPADRSLPRRGDVRVIIGEPLAASRSDWQGAIELQRAAREAISRHLDEGGA